jgi:uncharacterized protein YccT (UPF0319 family)
MKKATSKIKEVIRTKEYTNNFGTTIYHDLIMENGDKIQLGKKALQKVGWELSYEITDEGHEYNKAKSIKPEEVSGNTQSNSSVSNEPKMDVQRAIIAQNALTNAVNYHSSTMVGGDTDDIIKTMEKFFNAVISLANGK